MGLTWLPISFSAVRKQEVNFGSGNGNLGMKYGNETVMAL